jgi:Bacteriophage peptidoglycan hydrolase
MSLDAVSGISQGPRSSSAAPSSTQTASAATTAAPAATTSGEPSHGSTPSESFQGSDELHDSEHDGDGRHSLNLSALQGHDASTQGASASNAEANPAEPSTSESGSASPSADSSKDTKDAKDPSKADEQKKAEEAKQREEEQKALEDKKKDLEAKIAQKQKDLEQAKKDGDQAKVGSLTKDLEGLNKDLDSVNNQIQNLQQPTPQPAQGAGAHPPLAAPPAAAAPVGGAPASAGPMMGGGYPVGVPEAQAGSTLPYPQPSGPVPHGKIVPNGSGQDAVDLGKQYLGRNSIDIKGALPNFTAAGGQTNDCADFVSSCLESTGRIQGHHVGVADLQKSMLSQGYQQVSKDQAQPGDVWISGNVGHTELVADKGANTLLGSNNDRPGHQVISLSSGQQGGYYYHLPDKNGG